MDAAKKSHVILGLPTDRKVGGVLERDGGGPLDGVPCFAASSLAAAERSRRCRPA
ncbi:MAG: hypothetical protein ACRC67_05685 [Inquilinus sp.]|uniref:hypothetical protein n=1 Tax=Inquilinus sp. TaxID=1932117 RepID=UPI003F30C281